jgi:hypothetical protein
MNEEHKLDTKSLKYEYQTAEQYRRKLNKFAAERGYKIVPVQSRPWQCVEKLANPKHRCYRPKKFMTVQKHEMYGKSCGAVPGWEPYDYVFDHLVVMKSVVKASGEFHWAYLGQPYGTSESSLAAVNELYLSGRCHSLEAIENPPYGIGTTGVLVVGNIFLQSNELEMAAASEARRAEGNILTPTD